MVVTSKYSTSYSSCIRRRRINILHNAQLISDSVRQHASSDAHYDSWGQMVHVFCPGGCRPTFSSSPHFYFFAGGAKTGFARKNGRISELQPRADDLSGNQTLKGKTNGKYVNLGVRNLE